ncbi:hypothetical protein EDB19DRAFT_465305 [Suillus lakei]|nr:hypothetical protein EDB19DRAFT_465305 [Suillus lakei]
MDNRRTPADVDQTHSANPSSGSSEQLQDNQPRTQGHSLSSSSASFHQSTSAPAPTGDQQWFSDSQQMIVTSSSFYDPAQTSGFPAQQPTMHVWDTQFTGPGPGPGGEYFPRQHPTFQQPYTFAGAGTSQYSFAQDQAQEQQRSQQRPVIPAPRRSARGGARASAYYRQGGAQVCFRIPLSRDLCLCSLSSSLPFTFIHPLYLHFIHFIFLSSFSFFLSLMYPFQQHQYSQVPQLQVPSVPPNPPSTQPPPPQPQPAQQPTGQELAAQRTTQLIAGQFPPVAEQQYPAQQSRPHFSPPPTQSQFQIQQTQFPPAPQFSQSQSQFTQTHHPHVPTQSHALPHVPTQSHTHIPSQSHAHPHVPTHTQTQPQGHAPPNPPQQSQHYPGPPDPYYLQSDMYYAMNTQGSQSAPSLVSVFF